jgi:hypothetical protein
MQQLKVVLHLKKRWKLPLLMVRQQVKKNKQMASLTLTRLVKPHLQQQLRLVKHLLKLLKLLVLQ